jgi:hypothetical protein
MMLTGRLFSVIHLMRRALYRYISTDNKLGLIKHTGLQDWYVSDENIEQVFGLVGRRVKRWIHCENLHHYYWKHF